MTSPAPPAILSAAYSVPAYFVNAVQITFVNGLVRIAFFEAGTEPPEVISSPRSCIALTPESALQFFGPLVDQFRKTQQAEGLFGNVQKGHVQ